jgi:hypothetical protein
MDPSAKHSQSGIDELTHTVLQSTGSRHALHSIFTMAYRRNRRSSRGNSGSYFTSCKWCGERIHMREMPHSQWVAFGGSNKIHRCPERSDYEPTLGSGSRRGTPTGQSGSVPPKQTAPAADVSSPRNGGSRTDTERVSPDCPRIVARGAAEWFWWIVAAAILLAVLHECGSSRR